jgi:hypothetical protein
MLVLGKPKKLYFKRRNTSNLWSTNTDTRYTNKKLNVFTCFGNNMCRPSNKPSIQEAWRNRYYKRRYIPQQISSNSNTNLSGINSTIRVWLYNIINTYKMTIIVILINNNFLFPNFFSLKSTNSRSSISWIKLILDSQKWLFKECYQVQRKKPIIIKSNKNTRKIKKNWRILHFDL